MKKCPKCGVFMERDKDNDDEYHWICNKCDLFYCFDDKCFCCEEECFEDEEAKR